MRRPPSSPSSPSSLTPEEQRGRPQENREKQSTMDHVLKKYCPRIEFDSYEDFAENFRIEVPEAFNFGFDVVDEWARVEPDKCALLWCNDAGEERAFTFTDIKHLSNQAANAFADMGIGKGDVVMCILRRRWEYWVCAVALCKLGATIIPASLQLTRKDVVYRAPRCARSSSWTAAARAGSTSTTSSPGSPTPSSGRPARRPSPPRTSCSCTSRAAPRATPRPSSTTSPTRSATSSRRSTGSRCARTSCTCR